ncbi:hypothetical protein AAKU52_000746 [Pedobacter sp. CG_S7]
MQFCVAFAILLGFMMFSLEIIFLYCTFVKLIEKDGGIRPCDVLATCAYKVLHSTETA